MAPACGVSFVRVARLPSIAMSVCSVLFVVLCATIVVAALTETCLCV